ncbi:sigma-70 family RNA polymerase sigma factor [Streptomyces zingiberis]|uniref:sigma-70 family RNA polymerase sigma factor n=1 Tax=Streptomyces zingiberis TaxID=2053010 RepID=UPI002892C1D6|nr:sigma-70 family RNA polymerase sigma factor [Streptomyces zingiberis]
MTGWALAAGHGDRGAAESFVRSTLPDVRRYLVRLTGDPQGAEDLVQDTYLRALRSLPGFQGRSPARGWLLTIARRVVVDRIRSERARPRRARVEDWQTVVEDAQPRGLPGFDEGVALAELLARLPALRREVFVLTQLLGLPYAEAARIAGCPVGTVRSRVARARETLIALLEDAESDGAGRREPGSAPAGLLPGGGAPGRLPGARPGL